MTNLNTFDQETFDQETLDRNFDTILNQMLDSYGAETVVFRLQKKLETKFDGNGYAAEFARKEIEAVTECQRKISDARYTDISDNDLGVNQN